MKTAEIKINERLDRAEMWANRRKRLDKINNTMFAPLLVIDNNLRSHLPKSIAPFVSFALWATIGYLLAHTAAHMIFLLITVVVAAIAFIPAGFASWRESQNYAAIGSISRTPSDDPALERRIKSGTLYGHDYTSDDS